MKGEGSSRRFAEQAVAADILKFLEQKSEWPSIPIT
jgi:ribonuclease-3